MQVKSWVELIYDVPDELVGIELWESAKKFIQSNEDRRFNLKSSKVIMADIS